MLREELPDKELKPLTMTRYVKTDQNCKPLTVTRDVKSCLIKNFSFCPWYVSYIDTNSNIK
jgi:hypothetical protein